MSQSDNIDQLALALAAAQGAMKAAQKDGANPHFGNRYASLAAIIDAVREPLATNGLAFTQTLDAYIGESGVRQQLLITTLMHKSGQYITSAYPLPSNVKPQEFGSALTYGRRYSLSSICGIAADEDDDGEATRKPGGESSVVQKAVAAAEARKKSEVGTTAAAVRAQEKGPLDD